MRTILGTLILGATGVFGALALKAALKLSSVLLLGLAKFMPVWLRPLMLRLAGGMRGMGAMIPGAGMMMAGARRGVASLAELARRGIDVFALMFFSIAGYIDKAAVLFKGFFLSTLPRMLSSAGTVVMSFATTAGSTIVSFGQMVISSFTAVGGVVASFAASAGSAIAAFASMIASSLATVGGVLVDFAATAGSTLLGFGKAAIGSLTPIIGTFKTMGAAALTAGASIVKGMARGVAGMAGAVAKAVASAAVAIGAFIAKAYAALTAFFWFLGPGAPAAAAAVIAGAIAGMGALAAKAAGVFQRGGEVGRTGLALVGERGPELVKLPKGAVVYPASTTKEIIKILNVGKFQAGTPHTAAMAAMLGTVNRGFHAVRERREITTNITTRNYNINSPISLAVHREVDIYIYIYIYILSKDLRIGMLDDFRKEIMRRI